MKKSGLTQSNAFSQPQSILPTSNLLFMTFKISVLVYRLHYQSSAPI